MRFVARRLPICEVTGAELKGDVYVSPSGIDFRRVSIWGVVVRKFVGENHLMLVVDDFTGTIPVYLFDELKDQEIDEGDTIRVIGMVKEREREKRIVAEVVRRISPQEELVHRLQNILTVVRGTKESEEVVEEDVEVVDVL